MSEEQVVLVDDTGAVAGSAPRSAMRRDNLRHLVAAVLVRDSPGRVYVHRRTDTKDVFPGLHDCFAAGTVTVGESVHDAAVREVEEELGVVGVPLRPVMVLRYDDPDSRQVCHLFEVTWDGPITHQESEVAWGAWMTLTELSTRLADRSWPFVPDGRVLFSRWLEMTGTVPPVER